MENNVKDQSKNLFHKIKDKIKELTGSIFGKSDKDQKAGSKEPEVRPPTVGKAEKVTEQ
ncbi:hypothetical protein [Gynuella sp.]|uniref:hypothetical protein n=1 Tax=Gynuella sp. TaxID=2969146 RepID=UPI003D141140